MICLSPPVMWYLGRLRVLVLRLIYLISTAATASAWKVTGVFRSAVPETLMAKVLMMMIVGAPFADRNGEQSGSSYVVFGKATGFSATINLSNLNGSNGFRLDGGREP